MNTDYSPLRITLTGQFAAALRLAASTDKRTMIAFLEVNLPLLAPYAQAWTTLDALAVGAPSVPISIPPPAPSVPVVVPKVPWVDVPVDMTGWTDAQIAHRNSPEGIALRKPRGA